MDQIRPEASAELRLRLIPYGQPLTGHTGTVWWGAWGRIGEQMLLATGAGDGTVRLWDPATGTQHGQPVTGHTSPVRWGAWGRIGEQMLLATGAEDGTVRLWDPATGTQHGQPLTGHTGPVWWGAWGRIGEQMLLVTGGLEGTVRLWDPATGTQRGQPVIGRTGSVVWGAWGRIGEQMLLATGDIEGTVRLWDPATGTQHGQPPTGHTGPVWWGAWGRIGEQMLLATGAGDGTVRLWDPATGTQHGQPLTGHTGPVRWGAWGRIGEQMLLATGAEDGTVRLWDPATGTQHGQPVTGHASPVRWGAWGRIGEQMLLATGAEDGTVRLWQLAREVVVPRVPGYRSDTGPGRDLLGRAVDAVALADVITARSARPPLAVGLFGQWGEGKSLFLELLEEQVRQRATAAGSKDPIAHGWVRQVRFNAWHYAEADLWASIVAELFSQLSAPTAPDDAATEQRQRSRLASELIAARGIREQLAAAESRLTDLKTATRQSRTWQGLPEQERARLAAVLGPDGERQVRRLSNGWSTIDATHRTMGGLWRSLPRRYLAAASVFALAGVALLVWGPSLAHWLATAPAVALLVVAGRSVAESWRRTKPLRAQLGAGWQSVQHLLDEQDRRLATAVELAEAEVDELRSQLGNVTAAGQLAGLVQDRAGTGNYRQRLGLMTQIRQDFEHMARLLAEASSPGGRTADAAGDELPRIDRIVIYIDDLDRCPPHRVVEVLEAIHLLLAVRLFVVVVAVDPRWLLRSLASHYHQLFATTSDPARSGGQLRATTGPISEDEFWASTPAQYLEKIFQVVLTLTPMDSAGYQRMIDDLLSLRADAPPEPTPTTAPSNPDRREQPAPLTSTSPCANPRSQPAEPQPTLKSLPVIERVNPLALTAEERRFISLLGPPLITGPRAVKRVANSYGLLVATSTARSGQAERLDLQPIPDLPPHPDCYPYRAALVLLASVIGYPMLGPTFFPGLHHAAHADPTTTWTDYLAQLRPTDSPTLSNPLEPDMTAARARHWANLLDTLHNITTRAAEENLSLPHRLDIWAAWVQPVGRLSFPTGSAVSNLRPL